MQFPLLLPYHKHIWFSGGTMIIPFLENSLTFWNTVFSRWFPRFRKDNTSCIRGMIRDLK